MGRMTDLAFPINVGLLNSYLYQYYEVTIIIKLKVQFIWPTIFVILNNYCTDALQG